MNTDIFESFKEQYQCLRTNIAEIKELAEAVIADAETGYFISAEIARSVGSKLDEYCDRLEAFKKTGAELAINTEANISSISASIEEIEKSRQLLSERQMVLDFLRLTADTDELISRLVIAKEKLIEKCRSNAPEKALAPFACVVECVRAGNNDVSEDVLDNIEDGIEEVGRYISRAVDKGKLKIDPKQDISEYLDGSCELLTRDGSLERDAVPVTAEKEPEELPFESFDDFPWDEFDGILPEETPALADEAAENLSAKDFVKLIGSKPSAAECLIEAALKKTITNKDRLYINNQDVFSELTRCGYVGWAELKREDWVLNAYYPSSMGLAALKNADCRAAIEAAGWGLPLAEAVIDAGGTRNVNGILRAAVLNLCYLSEPYIAYCVDTHPNYPYATVLKENEAAARSCVAMFTHEDAARELEGLRNVILSPDTASMTVLAISEEDCKIITAALKLPDELSYKLNCQVFDIFGSELSAELSLKANWSVLGIENPDALIYTADESGLSKYRSAKANGKFGAKEFKKDFRSSVSKSDDKAKRDVFTMAGYFGVISPAMASELREGNADMYAFACRKLTDMGYLERYDYDGDSFYIPSSKGAKAFETKEAAEFLQVRRGQITPVNVTSASAAKVVALFTKTFRLAACIREGNKYRFQRPSLNEYSFSLSAEVGDEDEVVSIIAVISACAEDFAAFDEDLASTFAQSSQIVIVGYSTAQAREVANWVYVRKKDIYPDIKFAYGDLDECVIYECQSSEEAGASADFSSEDAADSSELSENPADADVTEQQPVSGDGKTADLHLQNVSRMLSEGKPYCATAYLYALAKKDKNYFDRYRVLAYALNDPLGSCRYTSDTIFDVCFKDSDAASECLVMSAVLRNFFYDDADYFDYSLRQLEAAVKGNSVMRRVPKLQSLIYDLANFKGESKHGIDYYSDYRQVRAKTAERRLESVRKRANDAYDSYVLTPPKENANMKRFLETKKIVFAKDGELAVCLRAAKLNSIEYIEFIEEYVKESFLKNGSDVSSGQIDEEKLNKFIDSAWIEAASKTGRVMKFTPLMSGLRTNLFMQIKNTVLILCDYAESAKSYEMSESDVGYISYKKCRDKILGYISASLDELQVQREEFPTGDVTVLECTLRELAARIDGTYNDVKKYFYLPFLRSEYVLLGADYLPLFAEVENLPKMAPTERILRHFNSKELPLESRIESILEGEDDYGSAELIYAYLEENGDADIDLSDLRSRLDKGKLLPRRDLLERKKSFYEELDLAQAYGQIDNTAEDIKDSIIRRVDFWCEWTLENEDYGFFYKIIDSFRSKIKEDSKTRAVDLEKSLAAYENYNPNWRNEELKERAVKKIRDRIKCQNYAAAEDLLNRLLANDLETSDRFGKEDYLDDFIREYSDNIRCARTNNEKPKIDFSRRNKEIKAAQEMIDNWPLSNGIKKERIRSLLLLMGFKEPSVKEDGTIGKYDRFSVRLKRQGNGRKENYSHPIAIFGSEAENAEFTVLCINGKMSPEALTETFKNSCGGRNALILLNYSLTLPERRELARISKKEYSGKTFAVIDRVVLVYLAKHYSETAINRMLMATVLPFASYQPYVPDSSKLMPTEMFMGRRKELQEIESASGVNIVYGGRQLGKSALLKMAQRDVDMDENGNRAVYVDIKGKDYKEAAKKVAEELFDQLVLSDEVLTDDWDVLARAIKNELRKNEIPYLLLLLDEADTFIDSCSAVNYKPFDALKDIQQLGSGRFKFVIAGLRNVIRFNKSKALGNNSVLAHLSHCTVKPFNISEARELLEEPLSYLGFRFPEDDKTEMLVSTIFGTTNYFPGLIQLYCSKLIEAMRNDYAGYDESDTPPYLIKEAHMKKALADKSLEEQIRDKFLITLRADEDDYYYLIALLAAYHYHNSKEYTGTAPEAILEIAEGYGIEKITALSRDKIGALMEEMLELNVFRRNSSGSYRFSRQSFCEMMGSIQIIDDEILKYADGGEA